MIWNQEPNLLSEREDIGSRLGARGATENRALTQPGDAPGEREEVNVRAAEECWAVGGAVK